MNAVCISSLAKGILAEEEVCDYSFSKRAVLRRYALASLSIAILNAKSTILSPGTLCK